MHETNSDLAVEIFIHSLLLIVILLSVFAILSLDKPVLNPATEQHKQTSQLIQALPKLIHSALPSTLSSRILQHMHPVISNPARSIQVLLSHSSQSNPSDKTNSQIPALDMSKTDTEELYCLAQNIYFEARGESQQGQLAVASVVLNRVEHRSFPDTICGVVKQGGYKKKYRCQFSWWCDGLSDRPVDKKAWIQSVDLAKRVLEKRHKDLTSGALWYHADYVSPYWRTSMKRGPKIGKHIFYSAKNNRRKHIG